MRALFFQKEDPYFNLAFEEALIEGYEEDTIRIWRNPECVVLGFSRDPYEDVRLWDVPVVRRFTGGGTVYNDKGCLNYSVVVKRKTRYPIEFLYNVMLDKTVRAFEALGIECKKANGNDLVVNGKKVSGTAAHISDDLLLLHGSILINCNIKELYAHLIIPKPARGIDPVKYRVANVRELDEKRFIDALIANHAGSSCPRIGKPSKKELEIANELYENKYCKNEWNLYFRSKQRQAQRSQKPLPHNRT